MTTAPTPQPEALRLAAWLNEGAWHQMRLGDVEAAGRELKRLHAENERLLAQVHKLEMDALDLASENSILKRQEQEELESRKPLPLSDEQIDAIGDKCGKPSATWHYEFARAIERRITGGSS